MEGIKNLIRSDGKEDMANLVSLNNVEHKDLKVNVEYSPVYGHAVGCVTVLPTEFADIQKEYPIFFQRDSQSNKIQAVALVGISPDENLFLEDGIWRGRYVPAVIAKGPFVIGVEDQSLRGGSEQAAVVMVDLDDPRINTQMGVSVFLEFGGESQYLKQVNSILNGIYQGLQVCDAMYQAFDELGLIEPCNLEITLANNEIYRIQGCHTINRDALYSLSAENVLKLHSAGFLEGAYLVLASLSNVQRLIEIKNSRG